jgi:uncharacterized protein
VSLGIITQRPGELDPTILSQCSTVFAMRLANDRDQEIIRSAISNSSISTTSFISSIGNGEAIAFGEAVAVPMRMRFSRVDEARLPRAHGITDKVEEDAPPIVDLRSIVSRMRAMNGPDISSFQQSYLAAESAQTIAREDDAWNDSAEAALSSAEGIQEPTLETYRPEMLPRASEPVNPQLERFNQIREQILSGQAERDAAGLLRPQLQPERSFANPAPEAHRQGSLRESLLKRPLGSIIRK